MPFRRGVAIATCTIAIVLLAIYAIAPTRNHYWDGIGFALNIEGVSQDEVGHQPHEPAAGDVYYNPNHLLYNAFGRVLYLAAKSVLPAARALDVLVWWSILASVATAAMLFHLLLRVTGQLMVSVWLTLLFGFSATWWKFSTDANCYVPGTAALVLCAVLAMRRKAPAVLTIGLVHALAMLLHQIAICFYPAMLVAIWTHQAWPNRAARVRAALLYSLTAGVSVATAYLIVWRQLLGRPADPAAFLGWVTFNGSDVLARKPALVRVSDMLVANLRVFFGGKLSLAINFLDRPVLIMMVALVLICATLIGRSLVRRSWQRPRWTLAREAWFPVVWLGSFLLFLTVWLTEYQYYRLFCLPGFILLLGVLCRDIRVDRWQLTHPLPAFVVLMAALNFAMYIGPYARVEASPPLQVALRAQTVLPADAVVYFAEFHCDNWWMKYFNMGTTWRKADPNRIEDLTQEVETLLRSGRQVYFDVGVYSVAVTRRHSKNELVNQFIFEHALGFSNGKHHIQLVELKPRQL